MRAVVVSIHDVSPATATACRRLRDLVDRVAGEVPVSLLCVPRYHGATEWDVATGRWVGDRADGGDEVVLHGLEHRGAGGRDGAEFGASTTLRAAAWALAAGRVTLARAGLAPTGFVAPAYAHPRALENALRHSGLSWWATRTHLRGADGHAMPLPSVGLGASTWVRRLASPTAAALAVALLRAAPAVRLDLHPADLAHPRLADRLPRLIEGLLGQARRPVVHSEFIAPPA